MKDLLIKLFFFSLLLFQISLKGQVIEDTLVFNTFFELVKKNHPMMKIAQLQTEKGKASLMQAKGAFDPQAYSYLDNKFYNGKEYYNYLNSGIKANTRTGIEVKAGYETSSGYFMNPDETTPQNGLYTAGVSIPVLQGMLIDRQRAALQDAKIFARSTEAEKQKITNDLLLNAGNLYWDWASLYNQLEVFDDAIKFSETRLNGIRMAFELGDRPAIDTVETLIQLQNFRYSYNLTMQQFIQKTYELSVFTWDDKGNPILLEENKKAPDFHRQKFNRLLNTDSLQQVLSGLASKNPELQLYTYKLSQLNIEKRFKTEKLKPKLNLRYNFLSYSPSGQTSTTFNTSNYKWGLEFGMPLFLRQERGDLKMTKIKIKETQLNNQIKQKETNAKIMASFRKCEYLLDQIVLMRATVENYRRMLEAEKRNFDSGESSVFLINSRELSLVQAELKLIESETKYRQSIIAFYHASGNISNHKLF